MSIRDSYAKIGELESAVRDHINTGRYQSDLIQDSQNWYQICSSLDVIGDTSYAIQSYMDGGFPGDPGLQYIYTYGVLQAVFVQQDAIENLTEAFDIPYSRPESLQRIRQLRNASIGHPTKQGRGKRTTYNFISRMTMSKNGFDLLRHSDEKSYEMVSVDIPQIVNDQFEEIVIGYGTIVEKLRQSDKEHKEKYKDKPLADCFPNGMRYLIQKIGEGIFAGRDDYGVMAKMHLDMVVEAYQGFRDALIERNEFGDYVEYDLNEFLHALSRIDQYLTGENDFLSEADMRIYHTYISTEHKKFVEIAEQIDEQYQAET